MYVAFNLLCTVKSSLVPRLSGGEEREHGNHCMRMRMRMRQPFRKIYVKLSVSCLGNAHNK